MLAISYYKKNLPNCSYENVWYFFIHRNVILKHFIMLYIINVIKKSYKLRKLLLIMLPLNYYSFERINWKIAWLVSAEFSNCQFSLMIISKCIAENMRSDICKIKCQDLNSLISRQYATQSNHGVSLYRMPIVHLKHLLNLITYITLEICINLQIQITDTT